MDTCKMPVTMLVAEDDEDDRILISEAFDRNCHCIRLDFVHDGLELLAHLNRTSILPGLILLDLNMPKLNGLDALKQIKSDPRSTDIPILVFSTSGEDDTILKSYCNGANTFFKKPSSFEALTELANTISKYWCSMALLPKDHCPIQKAA